MKYVYYPPVSPNVLWLGTQADLADSVIQQAGMENCFLVLNNENGTNVMRWKKNTLYLEDNTLPFVNINNTKATTALVESYMLQRFLSDKITSQIRTSCYMQDNTSSPQIYRLDWKTRFILDDGAGVTKAQEPIFYEYEFDKTNNKTNKQNLDFTVETGTNGGTITNTSKNYKITASKYECNTTGDTLNLRTDNIIYMQSPSVVYKYDTTAPEFNIYNDKTSAGDKVCSLTLKNVNSQISNTLTHSIGGNQCEYGMSCVMNDGGITTTTHPMKYELIRDGDTHAVITDLITINSELAVKNIQGDCAVKKAGIPVLSVESQTANGTDKTSTMRISNNEGEIDQNFTYYGANDSTEYNMISHMYRNGTHTYTYPMKYENQRDGAGNVTKNMFTYTADTTITGAFLPPVKPYACARTGNTPLTENLGVSTTWSCMPTLTPPSIDKSANFSNCFGTSDGYGFKYSGTRELRAHVCISITFFSSISTNVQWLLSHMLGTGGGYDVQCSNTIPSVTAPFNSCSLNGIVELKQNDIIRLVLSKTSSSDGTVSFLCNFSITPIDFLT